MRPNYPDLPEHSITRIEQNQKWLDDIYRYRKESESAFKEADLDVSNLWKKEEDKFLSNIKFYEDLEE